MRVLIDIGHPAHVHLFRFFAAGMQERGHQVLFTCRDKDNERLLLDSFNLENKLLGRHYSSSAGKMAGLISSVVKAYSISLKFKPDVFLSHGSIIAALTAWFCRKPHIALEDTGNNEQVRLYLPFTKAVLTSAAFQKDYGFKQIRYDSFHEMAYLRPRYFKTDPGFRMQLGVTGNEKLIIARFISWSATHDRGSRGLSDNEKFQLVAELSKYGRAFVSSENDVPDHLKVFLYPLSPDTIHQALANADLYIGEGATMASESCILGTPAIYLNPQFAGTIEAQKKSGLLFQYAGFSGSLDKARMILSDSNAKAGFRLKRDQLISETVDLTQLMIWFIENWPSSFSKMKTDPSFQKRFI